MKEQDELNRQQQVDENKEKLIYSPPILIVYETMDIQGGTPGVSESICGGGIGS